MLRSDHKTSFILLLPDVRDFALGWVLPTIAMLCLGVLALSGCKDKDTSDGGTDKPPTCEPGFIYHRGEEACLPIGAPGQDVGVEDAGVEDVGGPTSDGGPDDTDEDAGNPDVADVQPADDGLLCHTDEDNDGHISVECGGDDCDDSDPMVNPGRQETCSFKDNNCDGEINSGLDCTIYGHSLNDLYKVDPFKNTVTHLMALPEFLDMDTHPNGTLYGINAEGNITLLHRFDEESDQWSLVGEVGVVGNANGMAIDPRGVAYLTSSNWVYRVDLETAQATVVGNMGSDIYSSGDCVTNKDGTLFMSAYGAETDLWVRVDTSDGEATVIGEIGFTGIWGLTSAWGYMFGLADDGNLILIDPETGEGTFLHNFEGISWYGAASSAGR